MLKMLIHRMVCLAFVFMLEQHCVAASKPNIILIFADDLGYGDVGCCRSQLSTPEIDRLAKEGLRSTDCQVAANVCGPSRAALMTGRYPMRYGHPISRRPFPKYAKYGIAPEELTIAELLKTAGYSTNPVLRNSDNKSDFDSHLVDDSCLLVRDGKYWFYYKGRQLGKSAAQTKMGLAIAEKPGRPYIKHEANPVIPGNHEVVVWPQGTGVVAMVDGNGPKETANSILYAEDGIHFSKTHDVIGRPKAGGTYRPEAFTDSKQGEPIRWGVEIGKHKGRELPYIHRYDVEWSE